MIKIAYTSEAVEGEPGPNLYWMGSPPDYLRLLGDLHRLGTSNNISILLSPYTYIQLDGINEIEAASYPGSRVLCRLDNNKVFIRLDKKIWRKILNILLTLSFFSCHEYVDSDVIGIEDEEVKEDANIIISSEW